MNGYKIENPEFIIANKIRCRKCGNVIQSYSRHDYKPCSCGSIAVDGGISYLRRVGDMLAYEDLSVTTSDPFELQREVFSWGTRGKNGDEPLRFIPLCEMTSEHIEAILETQWQISDYVRKLFADELEFRQFYKNLVESREGNNA